MTDTNTAVGVNALGALPTGTDNTALGANALKSATSTATQNVAAGSGAGNGITSGTKNVIIGYDAASTLTTGSNNIVIGASATVSSAGTSGYLNIGGAITGSTLSSGTITLNPLINFEAKTQSLGDNTTKLATTAFVQSATVAASPVQLLYSGTSFNTGVNNGKLDFQSTGSTPISHDTYRHIEFRISNLASNSDATDLVLYFMNQGTADTGLTDYSAVLIGQGGGGDFVNPGPIIVSAGSSGPIIYGNMFIRMFGFFQGDGNNAASIEYHLTAYADVGDFSSPTFRYGFGQVGVLRNGSTWDGLQFVSDQGGTTTFTFDWAIYGIL